MFLPITEIPLADVLIAIPFLEMNSISCSSSTALIEKGLVIDRLLQNIIVADMDPKTLLVGDRGAIMIAARISAYGSAYSVDITCRNCFEKQPFKFDLKKTNLNGQCFDLDFLDENHIVLDETGVFNIRLPKSSAEIGVRMLLGKDEQMPEDQDDEVGIVTSALSRFIVSVNGDDDLEVVSQFVENMLASDSRYLRVIIPELTPNIDLKQEFVCKECGTEQIREVPLTAEFFWPR